MLEPRRVSPIESATCVALMNGSVAQREHRLRSAPLFFGGVEEREPSCRFRVLAQHLGHRRSQEAPFARDDEGGDPDR